MGAENRDMKTKQRAAWAGRGQTLSGGCISANTQTKVQKWIQQESEFQRLTSAREQNYFLIHSFTQHWLFSADLRDVNIQRITRVWPRGQKLWFVFFPLGQRLVSRCAEEALQGEPRAKWKTAIKRSLNPGGFPPILKCPTVLTAKTTADELFCGHVAAFEANPRPVDRSLTAINNNKREKAATSSKGKWRMKAKLQGGGPETWYAEKISHHNLRWPVQSSRTHDDGLTHKNTDWKFTVSLPTYACEASNSPGPFLYKRVNESDDKEMLRKRAADRSWRWSVTFYKSALTSWKNVQQTKEENSGSRPARMTRWL